MIEKTQKTHIPYNAYILTGGQSRRFLSDKSIAKLNNRTFTEILYDKLTLLANKTYLVGKDSSSHPFPFVEDKFPIQCALNGIITALNHSDTDWNFIISCDLPLIEEKTIQTLADLRTEEVEVVLPMIQQTPQPLCSFYNSVVLFNIQESLTRGNYRLRSIVDGLNTTNISIHPEKEMELLNINTVEDLKVAERIINLKYKTPLTKFR